MDHQEKNRWLYILCWTTAILTIGISSIGLFYHNGGQPFIFTNQYGDAVKIYGEGLYAQDSYFKAPIFIGSDFTMLFVACPLLITAIIRDVRRKSLSSRIFLTSTLGVFVYYAASISFGITYNFLQLFYILLFSSSIFGIVSSIISLHFSKIEEGMKQTVFKGVSIFLIITGIALYVAWLPDIITAMLEKRPLALIENYTTEITYVLDMSIIAPCCIICISLLKQKRALGFILLDILLTLCIIIGIMLPVQTIFQWKADIKIPLPALISKMGSFCLLALFAVYFKLKYQKILSKKIQSTD